MYNIINGETGTIGQTTILYGYVLFQYRKYKFYDIQSSPENNIFSFLDEVMKFMKCYSFNVPEVRTQPKLNLVS